MKAALLAVLLAAAGTAHAYTIDLKTYRYVMQSQRGPMLLGEGKCLAANAPKGQKWSHGAELLTVMGQRGLAPGCWRFTPEKSTYCAIDLDGMKLTSFCRDFDAKKLVFADSLPGL